MSYQQQYQQPYPAPRIYSNVSQPFKGGFHPLYIWSIACVVLTYGYIFLFFISSNYLRNVPNEKLSGLPFMYLWIPCALTIANTVIAVTYGRKIDRRYLLGAVLIIKYSLIPYFVAGGLLIAIFFLLIFTPVVIMIFVSPPIIMVLSVIGWFTLLESAPLMTVYLIRAAREGALKGRTARKTAEIVFCVFACIMQMFFCLDVLAAVICCFKEKRHIKITICVLAAPVVIFGVTMGIIIGRDLITKAIVMKNAGG